MKSLAIVYLCTGKYQIFWKLFYQSAQEFFSTDMKKEYFVFTDNLEKIETEEKVHLYYQPKIGWPYDVLTKWDCVCRIQDQLARFDYIALCNANMQFVSKMDILDESTDFWLTSYILDKKKFTFETNPISKAYIPKTDNIENYIQSGFIVAKSAPFIQASLVMRDWTNEDLHKGHIPLWHDESMFNAYIYNNKIQNIQFWNRGEVFPEEWITDEQKNLVKAIFRDKIKYGGHEKLRGMKLRFWKKEWSN